jgi:perosamine synthetase
LSIELDELRRLGGPGTRALYVIHYFGFPHPMDELRRFCDASGLTLIEDCAHSLFAEAEGRPAGSSGDIAIFSLHKYLPVPYGGALVVNNKHLGRSPPTVPPPPPLVLRHMIDLLGRNVTRSAFMNISVNRSLRGFISQVVQHMTTRGSGKAALKGAGGSPQFLSRWKDARMPAVSRWILQRIPEQQVIESRRRNFATLLDTVSGCRHVKPLIPELPDGACPGFFPVTVAGDVREFLRCSWDYGVPAFLFWPDSHPELPPEQFPESAWLKNNIVALPVHQGLGANDLSLLREVIHSWEQADR